jgi:SAM-dependent methyltransferase
MNSYRPVPHRMIGWLLVSTLAVVADCAPSRTMPVSDPAPASAYVKTETPPVTAGAPTKARPAGTVSRPPFDVPYWPTPQPIVDKMLELAGVKSTDVVYDLGCGDARSLVTAARHYGARGVGFEIDAQLVRKARENVLSNGVGNLVQIEQRDIFTLDLSDADVVFLFLLERVNQRLMPQLERMRPGSRIVSHEFRIPGARPIKTIRIPGPPDGPPGTDEEAGQRPHTLYLWKVPWRTQGTVAPTR